MMSNWQSPFVAALESARRYWARKPFLAEVNTGSSLMIDGIEDHWC